MPRTTRSTLQLTIASVAIALLAATGPFAGSADRAEAWRVVAVSGAVESLPVNAAAETDAWSGVARGQMLTPLSVVRTGIRGRTTMVRRDAVIVMSPGSSVELPSAAVSPGTISSVVQTTGSVLYEVDRRDRTHFEVVTPYLVAGVKGTSFLVSVDERGASVGVERGLVEVSSKDRSDALDVGPGDFVSLDRDGTGLRTHDELDREDRRERRREIRMMARLRDDRTAAGSMIEPMVDAIEVRRGDSADASRKDRDDDDSSAGFDVARGDADQRPDDRLFDDDSMDDKSIDDSSMDDDSMDDLSMDDLSFDDDEKDDRGDSHGRGSRDDDPDRDDSPDDRAGRS